MSTMTLDTLREIAGRVQALGLSSACPPWITLGYDREAFDFVAVLPGATITVIRASDPQRTIETARIDVNGVRFEGQHTRPATPEEAARWADELAELVTVKS